MRSMMLLRSAMLFLAFTLLSAPALRSQEQGERATGRVTIAGETYYVHTVKPGETFYSLGKLYDTDEQTIRARNPLVIDGLQPGQVLKIPVGREDKKPLSPRQMNKLFDTHLVNQGETAFSISKRYGIALATLMEDNPGFDPAQLSIGQKINIRISSQGEVGSAHIQQELDAYKETLDKVSPQFTHHVVGKGETLYSLSKSTGLPIDTITKYNADELKEGLKLGAILRLPLPAGASVPAQVTSPVSPVVTNTTSPSPTATTGTDRASAANTFPVTAQPTTALNFFNGGGAVRMKQVDITDPIRVGVLLPLKVGSTSDRRYLEFYQGVLVALEELKEMGVSTKVSLFNTGRSESETQALLGQTELQQADLIIGPVYDESFTPVAEFAAQRGIPVVSPLAAVEHADHSLIFEVAPLQGTKYDKLRDELSATNNVVLISSSSNDAEMQREIAGLLPASARKVSYTKGGGALQIENWLNMDKENTLIVLSSNEQLTEEILASISSIQNARISRGQPSPSIKVIGSSRWARFQNLDKNLFFKLNLRYVTVYHADRGNERVANFDRKYVAAFSSLPSMYAYRGYDVAKLFVGAIKLHGNEFMAYLNDRELPLLQTPYRFVQPNRNGKYTNGDWAKVCYNSNYTIDVQ